MTTANRFRFRAWDGSRMLTLGCMLFQGDKDEIVYHEIEPSSGKIRTDMPGLIVMQSTGLVDRTGREIFEFDILRRGGAFGEEILIVAWHKAGFRLFYPSDHFDQDNPVDTLDWEAEHDEIIGSKFANPELLK